MKVRLKISAAGAIAAWLAIAGVPLVAHHSAAAAYDATKKVEAQGKITKVLLKNPHSFVFVEATDEKGQPVEWQIEMGGVSGMLSQGWTKEMLAIGTMVKVSGAPSRAVGSHGMTNAKFAKPDGTPIGPAKGQYGEPAA